MKERPIIFSAPMVRAILDGRKSQTRRIVKPQPPRTVLSPTIVARDALAPSGYSFVSDEYGEILLRCPYGVPGDRLWVREAWRQGTTRVLYRVDDVAPSQVRWKPSIHMPRAASRITLEITDVRVERLQEIGEEDALAEGVFRPIGMRTPIGQCVETWDGRGEMIYADPSQARDEYRGLWESINGDGAWEANPWVWVVCFRRVM